MNKNTSPRTAPAMSCSRLKIYRVWCHWCGQGSSDFDPNYLDWHSIWLFDQSSFYELAGEYIVHNTTYYILVCLILARIDFTLSNCHQTKPLKVIFYNYEVGFHGRKNSQIAPLGMKDSSKFKKSWCFENHKFLLFWNCQFYRNQSIL